MLNRILVSGEAGRLAVKWQALRDVLKGSVTSPHHNPIIREAINGCDNPTALAIIQEYELCVGQWIREARVMETCERIEYAPVPGVKKTCGGCKKLTAPRRPNIPDSDRAFKTTCEQFQLLGWMAYTKDIDRSPTHCPKTRRALRSRRNSEVVMLLRHWEDGWDCGYQCALDLKLERKSKVGKPGQIPSSVIRGSSKRVRGRNNQNERNDGSRNRNG